MIGSVFGKLKKGLQRTRESVFGSLRTMLTGRQIDDATINEIEGALIRADVGVEATRQLITSIREDHKAGKLERGEDVIEHLKRELKAMWPPEDRALHAAPAGLTVIMVTGVNGAGKTTSIAKLTRYYIDQGKRVMLGACDTFRAGAVRQLEVWSDRLGAEIVKGQQGGDPAAVAFDAVQAALARDADVLILDTAGRLHTQDNLMRQLTKIRSVVSRQVDGGPHETLLVLDATSGQNAVRQAEEFGDAAGVTGIVLAKVDGTAKGGVVVAIRAKTRAPVKLIGTGETPEDLAPFDPDSFVEAMFVD